jgi:hypothetical protein
MENSSSLTSLLSQTRRPDRSPPCCSFWSSGGRTGGCFSPHSSPVAHAPSCLAPSNGHAPWALRCRGRARPRSALLGADHRRTLLLGEPPLRGRAPSVRRIAPANQANLGDRIKQAPDSSRAPRGGILFPRM